MPFVQVGAEKELRTVIEGESLFNDGTAYVLFLLFEVPAAALLQLFVRLLHMYMSVHACSATLQAVHCNRSSCTAALPFRFHSPYSRAGSICFESLSLPSQKSHIFFLRSVSVWSVSVLEFRKPNSAPNNSLQNREPYMGIHWPQDQSSSSCAS